MESQAEKIEKIRAALAANRKLRETLERDSAVVDQLLDANRRKRILLKARMRTINDGQQQRRRRRDDLLMHDQIFKAPYFIDRHGNVPPKVVMRGDDDEVYTMATMPPKPWTVSQVQALREGLLLHVRNKLLAAAYEAMVRRRDDVVKLQLKAAGAETDSDDDDDDDDDDGDDDDDDVGLTRAEVEMLSKESHQQYIDDIARIGAMDEAELLTSESATPLSGEEWDAIARLHLSGDRSGAECRQWWEQEMSPKVNTGEWSDAENKLLRRLVERLGQNAWQDVAAEIGNGRTPFGCLCQYQRQINSNILRRRWTPEEEAVLIQAVAKFGDNDWSSVATMLPGRNSQQCRYRWTTSADPSITKGSFSATEDLRIALAARVYNFSRWHLVQRHVPGRTDIQCRDRWTNVLDPKLTRLPWTREEDERLLELARIHHRRWARVAAEMNPRTDSQCWQRWRRLHTTEAVKKHVEIGRAARKVRRGFAKRLSSSAPGSRAKRQRRR